MDKSGANLVDIKEINKRRQKKGATHIKIKHLNNHLEKDYQTIKRKTSQIQTFKSFYCAKIVLTVIEIVHAKTKSLKRTRDYRLKI